VAPGDSPIGRRGRVTPAGAIRAGETGEVMISIRGGVEAFLAQDADGGTIDPYAEVVVVGFEPPCTVIVARLPAD
jgi:hypothetical protein